MSDPDRQRHRALLDAAEALDAALSAYERAAHGFLKLKLDSRKSILKAAENLGLLARVDEELSGSVGRLVAAVAQLRDEQQQIAEAVQKRAMEVLERKTSLEGLLVRLEALGQGVRDIGGLVPEDSSNPEDLRRILERVGELSESAHAFATEAQTLGFDDLAAEGHALRQQLLSLKNRASRLRDRTPSA